MFYIYIYSLSLPSPLSPTLHHVLFPLRHFFYQTDYYDLCGVLKEKNVQLHAGSLVSEPNELIDLAYTIGGTFPWNGFHSLRAQCHREQIAQLNATHLADLAQRERERMDKFWSEMAML